MTNKKKRQASRLRPIPYELKAYLHQANALPAPERLPGAEPKDGRSLREHWDSDERDVKALMKRYPRFRSFMAGIDVDAECLSAMVQRCLRLKTIRSILYSITRLQSNNQLPTGSVPIAPYQENLVSVNTDASGNLRIEHDPLLQALEGVEVSRIRECPICGALYWAGRLDRSACPGKWAHVLRQRRYRENYEGKYKLQRYRKAEEKNPSEEKSASEDADVQLDIERKKLESLHEHNSAHRTPRLPGNHK